MQKRETVPFSNKHKYKVTYGYDHVRGAYGIHYLGYGATHGDEYTNQGKYQKGFMIETIDTFTKKVYPQYIDLTNGFCNVAGKYYEDDQLLMQFNYLVIKPSQCASI